MIYGIAAGSPVTSVCVRVRVCVYGGMNACEIHTDTENLAYNYITKFCKNIYILTWMARALLGSGPVNISQPNTCYATIGEAVFSPCRAEPWEVEDRTVPSCTAPRSFPRQRLCFPCAVPWLYERSC
jgi:hypothetical protein